MTSAKPRMSISGWYHGPSAPQGAEQASLQQLQALKAGGDLAGAEQYVPFVEPAGGAPAEASGMWGVATCGLGLSRQLVVGRRWQRGDQGWHLAFRRNLTVSPGRKSVTLLSSLVVKS